MGRSMAPPSFALEASAVSSAGQANASTELNTKEQSPGAVDAAPKSEYDFEAMFYEIAGKAETTGKDQWLANAAGFVMDHYGWNRELITIRVSEEIKDWGQNLGGRGPDEMQIITLRKKLFKMDFGLIVRTIGHEYQHALENWSEHPADTIWEQEFKAYHWEITDKTVEKHRDPRHLKIAIFNCKVNYENMTDDQKEYYSTQYDEILAVESRL